MNMREMVKALEEKKAEIMKMGGEERIKRQHDRNKHTARERMDILFDNGTFQEIGILGTVMGSPTPQNTPADGVICGFGKVMGRMMCCAAYDFTVKGGSIGPTGEVKVSRMRELALRERIPMIWMIDSAGARIDPGSYNSPDFVSTFADTGYLFREQVVMSGVVPQVSAMVGPGAAGTAYIPGLADFVPMVKKNSSMALAGPPLVKAAIGEEISEEDLGGAKIHTSTSGVGDLLTKDDEECIQAIKDYLSYFPQSNLDKPARLECTDPADRMEDGLLDIIPDDTKRSYDMLELIKMIVDHGEIFEIKPKWAKNLITGFVRLGGFSVGVIANNPKYLGGILDVDSSDKAARFVSLCDAFNIPLLFLQDVPGFMVGSKVEKAGIIRHGAKMLYAVASATVPKLTVIVRKAYGAGYYVMNGRAYEPDLLLAYPGGEISVMGPEGMVNIAAIKMGGAENMPEEAKKNMADMIRGYIDINKVGGWAFVDDVIDPRETRPRLISGLELTENKVMERPWRKHGVSPV